MIEGEGNHAGTTPMDMRKDALVGASKIISLTNKIAKSMSEDEDRSTVGTVGKLEVHPNEPNVIPARVKMWIDIRDIREKDILKLEEKIIDSLNLLEREHNLKSKSNVVSRDSPAELSNELIK